MSIRAWLRRRAAPARPLTADEEEARRQADLLERDFADRGRGRWHKLSTLRRRN